MFAFSATNCECNKCATWPLFTRFQLPPPPLSSTLIRPILVSLPLTSILNRQTRWLPLGSEAVKVTLNFSLVIPKWYRWPSSLPAGSLVTVTLPLLSLTPIASKFMTAYGLPGSVSLARIIIFSHLSLSLKSGFVRSGLNKTNVALTSWSHTLLLSNTSSGWPFSKARKVSNLPAMQFLLPILPHFNW